MTAQAPLNLAMGARYFPLVLVLAILTAPHAVKSYPLGRTPATLALPATPNPAATDSLMESSSVKAPSRAPSPAVRTPANSATVASARHVQSAAEAADTP